MIQQVDHTPGRKGAIDGFQEVTIIAGTARRRRFSTEEKLRIVAESFDPAVSVSAVARRYGINPNQLFSWRRQLGEERSKEASLADCCPAVEAEAEATDGDVIEIALGGATIRVRSGVDGAALRRVLSALRAAR